MVTVIAGSRVLKPEHLFEFMQSYRMPISEVVCGCAEGIDRAGLKWAREINAPVTFFPAWADQYKWATEVKLPDEVIIYPAGGFSGPSKTYGTKRNLEMGNYSEAAIVVVSMEGGKWSNGSANMIKVSKDLGLVLSVKEVK